MKVFTVVGNRPQFIKSAPLSAALRDAGIEEVVLHTGQHWYHVLSQVFFPQLRLAEPRYRLDDGEDLHEAKPTRTVCWRSARMDRGLRVTAFRSHRLRLCSCE